MADSIWRSILTNRDVFLPNRLIVKMNSTISIYKEFSDCQLRFGSQNLKNQNGKSSMSATVHCNQLFLNIIPHICKDFLLISSSGISPHSKRISLGCTQDILTVCSDIPKQSSYVPRYYMDVPGISTFPPYRI